MSDIGDKWATLLVKRRYDGDPSILSEFKNQLFPVRDKILQNAALAGNETVLDVGCGDGLIAFGALNMLPEGRVIFADIDEQALSIASIIAHDLGVAEKCQFANIDARTLSSIEDQSVDVVTMRSMLIYIDDKTSAFNSAKRVLRRHGVLSIFEPVHSFGWPEAPGHLAGYDLRTLPSTIKKIAAHYERLSAQQNASVFVNERMLVEMAEQAGFPEIQLELIMQIIPYHALQMTDWESIYHARPFPGAPTYAEAITASLTAKEKSQLVSLWKPLVESGRGVSKRAAAYLYASC